MSLFQYVETHEFQIQNSLFKIGTNVDATYTDSQDIGFVGKYYNGANVVWSGLFRDATDSGRYKLFDSLQNEPTAIDGSSTVNTAGTGYALASLDVQGFHAFGNATIDGDLTVSGTTTTINVSTLNVEDNIIIANGGPANQKQDAGFVVRRIPANIVSDTAKQTGTASASGTTTTIELQASNGHGTTLDYYKGWVISLGGDVTGTAIVTSSTAADPPVLTFDTAATGSTTTSTTYNLYNKQYTGMIYDESTDLVSFYGFPREDTEAIIDPAGNAGNGNLADFINIKAADVTATNITATAINTTGNATIGGNLSVTGSIQAPLKIDDNIIAVNTGPNVLAADFGYVGQRTAANIGAQDTPKIDTVAVQTTYVSGTTLLITNAASGVDYFKGWVIGNSVNSEYRTITASSNASTTHTLTLSSGFTTGLTAGTDTVKLYNKRFVGSIYDESTDTMMVVGFPREDGETVIDPVAPVNGNIPDYVNMAVNNLTVAGTFTGTVTHNTKTQISATTFTQSDIFSYDIIYLNPSANTTYTLPQISTLTIAANTSYIVVFVNINASNAATIAAGGSDTIEGAATLPLRRQWLKTVLVVSDQLATTWLIKG